MDDQSKQTKPSAPVSPIGDQPSDNKQSQPHSNPPTLGNKTVPSSLGLNTNIPNAKVSPFSSRLESRFGAGLNSSSATAPKDPHVENLEILKSSLGENRIKEYEPMSKHTTFRIGGPAEFFFEAETIDDLIRAITFCRQGKFLKKPEEITEEDMKRVAEIEKEKAAAAKPPSAYGLNRSPFGRSLGAKKEAHYQLPFFILGGGSNILVSDRGIPGLTIKVKAAKINIGSEIVEAYAGTLTGYLLQKVLDADLTGMEFLDGVPGTIGGAVYNNAKAFFLGNFLPRPKSISEIIYDLTVMTKEGKILIKSVEDYEWNITHNNIAETGDIILVVRLKLKKGVSQAAERYLTEYHEVRKQKPYMRYPSAGSIFHNPEGASAGKLIDECGLKGRQQKDAQISPEHGNIFINLGKATASDVRFLIDLSKEEVTKKFHIDLQEEIRYMGDFRTEAEIEEAKNKIREKEKKEREKVNNHSLGGEEW